MSKKSKRIIWPLITVFLISASVVVFANTRDRWMRNAHFIGLRHPEIGRATSLSADAVKNLNSTLPQSIQPAGAVQIVRFTLYDAGIFPREMRVSAGLVGINLEDMSGGSAGLILQNESKLTLGQIVLGPRQWRASGLIRLEAGRYRVFDASQSKNWATLIAEP